MTNIELEYEVINSQELADEDFSNYRNGKRFMYEQFTHLETNSVDKGLDTTINESIKEGTSSVYEPYVAGVRDSENVYSDITEVKVVANGIPMRFTVKEQRQEICRKRSSKDLEKERA